MIKFENFSKHYGSKIAVNNLNLEVERGTLFAFLGPNGAGKTTSIKTLAGLLRPTSGNAYLGGFDVVKDPLKAKSLLAYVPEQPYLYEKLTGREFMLFVAKIYSIESQVAKEKIDEMITVFGMEGYIDQLTETYSHGMKQKIIISSMLLHDPTVILIDEPLVGLDPESSKIVKKLLRAEVEKGKTVFMSTHVLSIAEEVADNIGIIFKGELIARGTIDDLRKMTGKEDNNLEDIFLFLTSNK